MNGTVYRTQQAGFGGGSSQFSPAVMLNNLGQQIIMDWRQKAVLDGCGFQVRPSSTISVTNTGDGTAITDTAAEFCADAATGTVIVPVYMLCSIETPLDAGEGAFKAVSTVSSAGTAVTPLLLRPGASAAVTTARAQETGNVTVTAELVTTTLLLHRWIHIQGTTSASEPWGPQLYEYRPLASPVLDGPRCLYVQVSLDTYWAHFDYLEFDGTLLTR